MLPGGIEAPTLIWYHYSRVLGKNSYVHIFKYFSFRIGRFSWRHYNINGLPARWWRPPASVLFDRYGVKEEKAQRLLGLCLLNFLHLVLHSCFHFAMKCNENRFQTLCSLSREEKSSDLWSGLRRGKYLLSMKWGDVCFWDLEVVLFVLAFRHLSTHDPLPSASVFWEFQGLN